MQSHKFVVDGLYLFNQSPAHLNYTLSEFNHFFIFPLLHGKARIWYDGNRPVSLGTWAWFTDEEADDFLNDRWIPPEEVYRRDRSDQLWGVEFIAPFGHARQTMRNLRRLTVETYGPDTAVHFRRLHKPNTLHKRII